MEIFNWLKKDNLKNKQSIKLEQNSIIQSCILVENYRNVLDYICKDFNRSIKLTKYLKIELTKIFGKHNTVFRSEFYYYVWIVEFDNKAFQIFTNKDKGTQITIVGQYGDDNSKVCINFLKKLETIL